MKTKHLLAVLFAGCLAQTVLAAGGALTFYSITKGVYYHQEPGDQPALRPYKPWYFEGKMLFTNNSGFNPFISASIIPPGSIFGSQLFPQFYYVKREDSQAALDKEFTNGTYRFSFFVNTPPNQTVSNVLAAGPFPPAPGIANLGDAQAINPANDFTLTWNAFPGGRTNDLIYCTIQTVTGMVVQTSSLPGASNAMDGTVTSILIPANTLKPGHSYIGRLGFVTVQSTVTNQYPGAFGATLYLSQSDFYIKTTGAGDTTPPNVVATIPANGSTGVPTNLPVVFTFNKTMMHSWDISWTGGTATNWTAGFDTNMLRFALGPSLDFTTNQSHTVLLNGLNQQLLFADTNANLLPPDTVITFSTGASHYDPGTPLLSAPRFTPSGGLQLDLLGATQTNQVLLASTNLVDWYPLMTNSPFYGTVNFSDPAPGNPAGYYRTISY